MIELRITAENPKELHNDLLALLAGTSVEGAGIPAPGKDELASTKRGGRKSSTAPADAGATTQPAAQPAASGTSTEKPAEPAASSGPVTRESIAAKATQLAQKAGPGALGELFGEFGATKLSEIAEDKYPAVDIRLSELLAA